MTRILNLLLEKIRIYTPEFMAEYGNMIIVDAKDHNNSNIEKVLKRENIL